MNKKDEIKLIHYLREVLKGYSYDYDWCIANKTKPCKKCHLMKDIEIYLSKYDSEKRLESFFKKHPK